MGKFGMLLLKAENRYKILHLILNKSNCYVYSFMGKHDRKTLMILKWAYFGMHLVLLKNGKTILIMPQESLFISICLI